MSPLVHTTESRSKGPEKGKGHHGEKKGVVQEKGDVGGKCKLSRGWLRAKGAL